MNTFPIIFTFDKSVGDLNSRVEIYISNDQTIFSILKEACQKIGIVHSESFQVFKSNGSLVEICRTVEYNQIAEGSQLIITEPGKGKTVYGNFSGRMMTTKRLWKPLAIIGLALSIVGLLCLITIYVINSLALYSYSVVIDAGSTSSKIYLYSWQSNKFFYNADIYQVATCKYDLGISNFEDSPNQSFVGIKECLDTDIVPKIPTDKKSVSYIFLGATAGMRMLSYKNPNATTKIMNFLRQSLSKYALKINNTLTDISIISGSIEGLMGWITVNYLFNNFPKTNGAVTSIIGAMDMGGASSQVTFLDSDMSKSNGTFNLTLYGKPYRVYSHSYLCYGKSQAEWRLLAVLLYHNQFVQSTDNPCMFLGEEAVFSAEEIFQKPCIFGKFAIEHYGFEIILPDNLRQHNFTFVGRSNYTQCQQSVNSLFNTSKCGQESTCTFNGVYQPTLSGKFGAFSAYPMIREHLNPNNDNFNLRHYKNQLKITCDNKSKIYNAHEDVYAKWLCFDLTFLIEMLVQLGFNDTNWKDIEFINTIGVYNIGWSLGYMIDKTALIPKEKHFLPIEDSLFGILVSVLILILIFALAFLIMALKARNMRGTVAAVHCDPTEEETLLSSSLSKE